MSEGTLFVQGRKMILGFTILVWKPRMAQKLDWFLSHKVEKAQIPKCRRIVVWKLPVFRKSTIFYERLEVSKVAFGAFFLMIKLNFPIFRTRTLQSATESRALLWTKTLTNYLNLYQPFLNNSSEIYRNWTPISLNSDRANQPEHSWLLLCMEDN